MKRLKTLKYIAFCTLTAAAFTSCEILDSGSRSTSDLEIDGTTIKLHVAKGNTRGVEYYTPTDEEGGYTLPIDPDKVSLPLAIKVMTEEVESKWQNIQYGSSNLHNAGCGIIAAYNTLVAMGESPDENDLVEMIADMEKSGAVISGLGGTAPTAIKKYFKKDK